MSAVERETIDPLQALASCLVGIEQQLDAFNTRLAALEDKRSAPAPELAQLEGLDKLRKDVDQIWTATLQLPDLLGTLNRRIGEIGEGVELALVALPRDDQRRVYRTRAHRAAVRWANAGD